MDRRRTAWLKAMGIPQWVDRESPPPASRSIPPSQAIPASAGIPAADGLPDWAALEAEVAACTRCELHRTRTRAVFGRGDRVADWMVVGEAPGAEEDRRGEPFVGRAGQLLDEMLAAVGLGRGQAYIANILKSRPPGNRDPLPEEVRACAPFLERQIALVRPRVLLAVGRVAAQNLLGSERRLGELRGRVHRYPGTDVPVVVTFHPAYLLRTPIDKRKAWEDLRLAARLAAGDA